MKSLKTFPDGTHNETWMCPGFFQEFSQYIKEVSNVPPSFATVS